MEKARAHLKAGADSHHLCPSANALIFVMGMNMRTMTTRSRSSTMHPHHQLLSLRAKVIRNNLIGGSHNHSHAFASPRRPASLWNLLGDVHGSAKNILPLLVHGMSSTQRCRQDHPRADKKPSGMLFHVPTQKCRSETPPKEH